MADIIILGPAHPLRGGGMATFNERMAREFQHLGHKVCIYTFSLQYPGLLFPGKSQYSDEPPPNDLDIRVRMNSMNPFNWFVVGKEISRMKPDLLIIRYWMPFMAPCLGTIASVVDKNQHTRIISIADNIKPHEKRPGDRLLTKYFVKHIHHFIVMSASVKADLKKFAVSEKKVSQCLHPLYDNYGEKTDLVQARAHLGLPQDAAIVLFFGFIRHYKGLDLLIKAFNHDKIKNKPILLLVAGEFYTDTKPYFQLVKKLKLNNQVIWHNHFISDNLVKYYFSASDLVAQPYKEATQSGVTQVAYHFEIPMLVTNVGGLPEMVPHMKVGYVVDPHHYAIAEAIADYFENGRQKAFVRKIISEKKRFSWSRFADTLLGTIN